MISKKNRISKVLFEKVIKEGYALHSPLFTLKYKANNENISRFAVVAPKGFVKKASDRNSLRRKVYRIISKIPPKKPLLAIVLYKKQAINCSYEEISSDITTLFNKISIKNE